MRSVEVADAFIERLSDIYSEKLLMSIEERMKAIVAFPGIGSSDMRRSVEERFGRGLQRFPIPPYVIVYRYDEQGDKVSFIALLSGREIK